MDDDRQYSCGWVSRDRRGLCIVLVALFCAAFTAGEVRALQNGDSEVTAGAECCRLQETAVGFGWPAFRTDPAGETVRPPVVEEEAAALPDDEPVLDFGGVLRFNYLYMNWPGEEDNRNRWGEIRFDTFRINVIGSYSDFYFSSEYRFYAGYHMLKSGYVGYEFNGPIEVQAGLNQVPFGILPYASSNWFFQLPYYVGLEDSHAAGVKFMVRERAMDLQIAAYLNDGGSYTGSTIGSARYSYDVVHTDASELGYADSEAAPLDFDRDSANRRRNSKSNQLNIRAAYSFAQRSLTMEAGASAQLGQLYNAGTKQNGHHWAAALHGQAAAGRWQLMLQALRYEYRPKNPEDQNDDIVVMGAYDAPYKVAARANILQSGLSYSFPVDAGPVSTITFYNDFSLMVKDHAGFDDSMQNVTGMMITAGQLFTYVDLATGKNHAWFGPDYGTSFAEGSRSGRWRARFNINVGYYF